MLSTPTLYSFFDTKDSKLKSFVSMSSSLPSSSIILDDVIDESLATSSIITSVSSLSSAMTTSSAETSSTAITTSSAISSSSSISSSTAMTTSSAMSSSLISTSTVLNQNTIAIETKTNSSKPSHFSFF